jgi:hypothetical protein
MCDKADLRNHNISLVDKIINYDYRRKNSHIVNMYIFNVYYE